MKKLVHGNEKPMRLLSYWECFVGEYRTGVKITVGHHKFGFLEHSDSAWKTRMVREMSAAEALASDISEKNNYFTRN